MNSARAFVVLPKLLALGGWIAFSILAGVWSISAGTPYREIDVKNGGTISGVVRFAGTVPPALVMSVSKDDAVCGKTTASPRFVIGKDGGVKNCLIALENIVAGKSQDRESEVLLDQRGCVYEPHVTILPLGANLTITNSDGILHNVHAYDQTRGLRSMFNIAQPLKGQKTVIKAKHFPDPGILVTTCDAGHPWMSAYIVVTEHPYVAVTDADGMYILKDVPPGTYTITMWHEGVAATKSETEKGIVKKYSFEQDYEVRKQVAVKGGDKVLMNFELALR